MLWKNSRQESASTAFSSMLTIFCQVCRFLFHKVRGVLLPFVVYDPSTRIFFSNNSETMFG